MSEKELTAPGQELDQDPDSLSPDDIEAPDADESDNENVVPEDMK